MLKIVLDTNVLISAILFGGKPRKILDRVVEGKVDLFISQPILEELEEVLKSSKFKYPPEIAQAVLTELNSLAKLIIPTVRLNVIEKDPDDDRILECAMEAKADFIISGDKHLLSLQKFRGISIQSPQTWLENRQQKLRLL